MADIFISYAREDETRIRRLVDALEEQGWSIFWDRRIPAGKTWQSYIGQALSDAKCVIVAWSRHSILSEWVMEEANDGKKRGLLIPIFLDSVEPPLGFRGIQAADLTDWRPGSSSYSFDQLIQDIAAVVGGKPHRPTPEGELTPRTQPVATPKEIPTEPPPYEPAPPKPEPMKARFKEREAIKPEDTLVGMWQQFFIDPEKKAWVSGGLHLIFIKDNKLHMAIIDTSTAPPDSTFSLGVSNVDFDGQYLTFDSNWDVGVTAKVKLEKIDDNTFEGYTYLGEHREKNRWVRMK